MLSHTIGSASRSNNCSVRLYISIQDVEYKYMYIYDVVRGCTSKLSVTSSCTRWPSSAGPSGTHGLIRPWYSAEWATCGPGCWWGRHTRRPPRRSPSSAWWASGGCVASPAGRTSPSFLKREWLGVSGGTLSGLIFFPPCIGNDKTAATRSCSCIRDHSNMQAGT